MILEKEQGVVKFGLMAIAVLVGVFGIWMGFAPLKSAAVAVGQVAVQNNKKLIQHLEGGVVEHIYVKDGDKVKAGTPLVAIKNAKLNSDIDLVKSSYLQASVLVSRLEAQRDGKDEVVFEDEVKNMAGFELAAAGQISLFNEQNKLLKDEIDILSQRIAQLENQIKGFEAIVKSKSSRVASLNEETKEWERLFKEQLTDKIRLRDIQRERVQVDGEIAQGKSEIARLNVQITETKQQILVRERSFKEEILRQLEQAKIHLIDQKGRLSALNDQEERALIKSPVSGTVVGVITHTIGGVVKPSETIMSVVPDDVDYIIEAKLQITDIDQVHTGLLADVRFSAFHAQFAHVVEGKVDYVSADTLKDERANPYYEIKVSLTKDGVKSVEENGFFLTPGMPAEVIVVTGERTMLSYLIKPLSNMFQRAFNED